MTRVNKITVTKNTTPKMQSLFSFKRIYWRSVILVNNPIWGPSLSLVLSAYEKWERGADMHFNQFAVVYFRDPLRADTTVLTLDAGK